MMFKDYIYFHFVSYLYKLDPVSNSSNLLCVIVETSIWESKKIMPAEHYGVTETAPVAMEIILTPSRELQAWTLLLGLIFYVHKMVLHTHISVISTVLVLIGGFRWEWPMGVERKCLFLNLVFNKNKWIHKSLTGQAFPFFILHLLKVFLYFHPSSKVSRLHRRHKCL